MNKKSAISVLVIALCMSAFPFSSSAKGKPGGGGSPGSGYELLTEEPAMLYAAWITNNDLATVFSNADGTAKQALQWNGQYLAGTYSEFVPGQQSIICNLSFMDILGKVDYSVDPVAGIVVDSVTVLDNNEPNNGNDDFRGLDTSADGQWVLYASNSFPDNVIRFKAINDSSPPISAAFHPDESIFIWNAVWVDTPNHMAVFYTVVEDGRKKIALFSYDPSNPGTPPLRVTDPFVLPDTAGGGEINYAVVTDPNWTDGVIVTVTIVTGTTKSKGRIVNITEQIVHQLEFDLSGSGNPASFYPLGPSGNEVQGNRGAYSSNGQFIATDGANDGSDAIWVTEVSKGSYLRIENVRSYRPDWNPNL